MRGILWEMIRNPSHRSEFLSGKDNLKLLKVYCREYQDIVQEMADQCLILDGNAIDICLREGIKFDPEFLKEIGYTD
jgi:hypothetical protein